MRQLRISVILLISLSAMEIQAGGLSEMEAYQLEVCREKLDTFASGNVVAGVRHCLNKIKKKKKLSPEMETMVQKIEGVLPTKKQLKLNNPLSQLELQTANVEILANSAAWGAAAGYYLTAITLSANRTDQAGSNGWIGTMPPLGALTGATLGLVLNRWLEPQPGTVAWATANTWWGLAWGQTLGNIVLANNTEVENIPLTFAFPFLSMSVLPAATYAVGKYWHVSPGDVALANSATFWISALTMPHLFLLESDSPGRSDAHVFPTLLPLSMLTHFGMMAAAPLFDVPRAATWILEASAGIGFVLGATALATAAVIYSNVNTRNTSNPLGNISPETFYTSYFTGSTALGLLGGAVLLGTSFNRSQTQSQRTPLVKTPWALALKPQLSPLLLNSLNPKSAAVSGVLASWRY